MAASDRSFIARSVAALSRAVGKDGTVIAIDVSAEMVEYLANRQDELGPARIVPQKVGFDDPELKRRASGWRC